MEQSEIEFQKSFASFFGRLIRDTFGKGPEAVYVSFCGHYFTVYLKNFISPIEKILEEQNHNAMLNDIREKLVEKIQPEIKAYIQIQTNNFVKELYADWGLHNHSGMFVGICEEAFTFIENEIETDYLGKQGIEEGVIKLSHYAQKAPEEIRSFRVNPRTILVIRNGILVRIEKELIRIGQTHTLKTVKRGMEKSFLHNNINFEKILNEDIMDIFVDWDFELDRSVITIVTNPNRMPDKIPSVEMS